MPLPPVRIAPSILSADFGRLADEVRAAEAAGADVIHVDVMDGRFVPNITVGPLVVKAVRGATRLPVDVHLMIVEPERYVEAFAEAGADLISVHAEVSPHLHRTLQVIRASGARPSVALNPSTDLTALEWVLGDCAQVLVMTVNPGFGGQEYVAACSVKVRRLRDMADRRGLPLDIEVDGGINEETAELVAGAGANVLVAGTAVFGAPDYRRAIADLRAVNGEGAPKPALRHLWPPDRAPRSRWACPGFAPRGFPGQVRFQERKTRSSPPCSRVGEPWAPRATGPRPPSRPHVRARARASGAPCCRPDFHCESIRSTRTSATPRSTIPSARAAASERSTTRPRTNGPRSFTVTTTRRPFSRSVTMSRVPKGSWRCAQVNAAGS